MVRLTGPLFSQKASKQLGKKLIYKTKGNRSFLTKYNKPGGVAPFDPSPTQRNQRMLYNLIIANWQIKSTAQKKVFNDLVTKLNLKMSGWNYFLREALKDLPTYLGLQGYWAFNRIVGGEILDLSGNGNDGTLEPSYPSNAPTLVNSLNKKFGKAGNFDGIDDHVGVGNPATMQFDIDTPFSIELWIKAPFNAHNICPVSKTRGIRPVGLPGWFLWIWTGDQKLRFELWDGTNIFNVGSSIAVMDDVWHYIVTTFDGSQNRSGMKLYLEGVLDITGVDSAISSPITNSNPLTIGAADNNNSFFDGIIDDVRIYNRVLSAEEIKKHYQLKFT